MDEPTIPIPPDPAAARQARLDRLAHDIVAIGELVSAAKEHAERITMADDLKGWLEAQSALDSARQLHTTLRARYARLSSEEPA